MNSPTIPDYESYDYGVEWSQRRLEDLAEKDTLRDLLPAGGLVLELGGGFGRLTEALTLRYDMVVMVDASSRNTRLARTRAPLAEIVKAELTHLPFRSGVFDRLVMIRVVHHLPEPDVVFDEMRRVAAQLGVGVVSIPNSHHFRDLPLENSRVGTGPQGHAIYAAPLGYYTKRLPVKEIRGVGLFDNAFGRALRWALPLSRLDVATGRLWRMKKTLFLKFEFAN